MYDGYEHVNLGSGEEISINELAIKIANLVGYKGKIENDLSKPDGTMRKLMDNGKIKDLGWRPKIKLDEGIQDIIKEFNIK